MSTKYAPLAARIVELVGGTDNIRSAFHCQTRLRFQLRDESKVDTEALTATDGVVTALSSGGMYQVVIGMHVRDVHEEVEQIIGEPDGSAAEADEPRKSPVSKAIDFISGTFVPVIPAIAGAGMLRAVLTLLLAFGVITNQSQTYLVLNFMADAVFSSCPSCSPSRRPSSSNAAHTSLQQSPLSWCIRLGRPWSLPKIPCRCSTSFHCCSPATAAR